MKLLRLGIALMLGVAAAVLILGDFVVGATILGLPAAIMGDILGAGVGIIALMTAYSALK